MGGTRVLWTRVARLLGDHSLDTARRVPTAARRNEVVRFSVAFVRAVGFDGSPPDSACFFAVAAGASVVDDGPCSSLFPFD